MIAYDYAVLCVRPCAHGYDTAAVGVVLHARTEDFLEARVLTDRDHLDRLLDRTDRDRVVRYLDVWRRLAHGEEEAGPLALLPPSERFHWMTAPRSDLLHASPVHGGRTTDLEGALDTLFRQYVTDGSR